MYICNIENVFLIIVMCNFRVDPIFSGVLEYLGKSSVEGQVNLSNF
jgi:hypothetical protein